MKSTKCRIIFYNLSIIHHLCELGLLQINFALLPLFPQAKSFLDSVWPHKEGKPLAAGLTASPLSVDIQIV